MKNGCGGLRDYQSLLWVTFVKCGGRSMADLARQKLLSPAAFREMERGYDFLHRVRNRFDLPCILPGADHEVVGEPVGRAEIQNDDILGLLVGCGTDGGQHLLWQP